MQLGNEAASLDLLEEAIKQNYEYRHLIATDPDFCRLANHARFQAIIDPRPTGRYADVL